MPTPNKDESHDDFVQRCIPIVIDDGTAQDGEQATAICNSMWDDHMAGAKANAKLANRRIKFSSREVNIKAAKGDDPPDTPATFSVLAYSGGLLYVDDFDLPVVVDLKGLKFHKNLIANLDHDDTKRVGHVTDAKNDGKTLELTGVASAENPAREEVIGSAKNDYPWEASIEADLKRIVTVPPGKQIAVNGQQFTGPIYVSRQSTLLGFGFVTHGGDLNTQVRIAASAVPTNKEKAMSDFEKWAADQGWNASDLSEQQTATLQAAYSAQKPKKASASNIKELMDGERLEAERVKGIREMTYEAIKAYRGSQNYEQYFDSLEELAESAVEEGTSLLKYENQLLKATRPQAPEFKVGRTRHEPDVKVLTAALCMSAGLPHLEKHFSEDTLEAVDRSGLRHFSIQQLLLKAASANGYQAMAGERITQGNIRSVLKAAFRDEDSRSLRAAGQFSTNTLTTILSTAANKEILAGFSEEDNNWREISAIKSVTDFKQVTAYRMTDSLVYEQLPKGGEIAHGSLGQESFTRQVKTYAKMLGLDRQDIINDDLGAFDDLRTQLGRGAARKFNDVFWTAFMSNLGTTFTTARTNYISGATSNLGTDGVGLGLAVSAFRAMTSADGKRIGGEPKILMVPPDVEFIADQLFNGGSGESQTVANTNVFRGKYKPLVVPQLTDTSFTGNSNTAFYLFRDPGILAIMHVSFLNGQQTPTVESTDADFNTLGILFRGYHDFGADVADYLAGVMSKGAA